MDAETSSQSAHRTRPIPFDLGKVHVITIGIDPHKSSHTAVAVDTAGHQLAQRRFVVNAGTVGQLMRWCERWPERRFAVEGAKGLGRSLAQQLASAGEHVVDVPSTLPARARLRVVLGGVDLVRARGEAIFAQGEDHFPRRPVRDPRAVLPLQALPAAAHLGRR